MAWQLFHLETNGQDQAEPFGWYFLWRGRERGCSPEQGDRLLVENGRAGTMCDAGGEYLA